MSSLFETVFPALSDLWPDKNSILRIWLVRFYGWFMLSIFKQITMSQSRQRVHGLTGKKNPCDLLRSTLTIKFTIVFSLKAFEESLKHADKKISSEMHQIGLWRNCISVLYNTLFIKLFISVKPLISPSAYKLARVFCQCSQWDFFWHIQWFSKWVGLQN